MEPIQPPPCTIFASPWPLPPPPPNPVTPNVKGPFLQDKGHNVCSRFMAGRLLRIMSSSTRRIAVLHNQLGSTTVGGTRGLQPRFTAGNVLFTDRKRSSGKVMFSQMSVHIRGRVSLVPVPFGGRLSLV